MSHKTLYIDIDEEITSIVDRVRKAAADEVIIVVPKRALLIQSLVNLKLLKKEANRRKKRLMIVTQDKIGKKLIEKAGILVQRKMDDSMAGDEIFEKNPRPAPLQILDDSSDDEEETIGSSNYFDEPLLPSASAVSTATPSMPKTGENIGKISFGKKKKSSGSNFSSPNSKKFKKESSVKNQKSQKGNRVRLSDIVAGPKKEKEKKSRSEKPVIAKKKTGLHSEINFHSREIERQKNLEPEKFFQASNFSSSSFSFRKEEKVLRTTRVKGRAGKYFVVFLGTFFLFGATASVYFFLPKATIVLHLKTEEKSASLMIEANTQAKSVDEKEKVVPAALEQITKEKNGEFDATGSQSGAGKSTGKVVIYNEFSSENQPLVATTRLQTSDGKIFRITKGVIVPGVTKVGGETKPGAIEVEVVADKPGKEYDIEPTTFKIPGFEGGPKYEKFHAESVKPMKGGSGEGAAIVTAQDLAKAKEKLVAEAKKEILDDLKGKLGDSRHFFGDTTLFDIISSSSSEKAGAQAQKFTFTVNLKARILSFQKSDVEKLIEQGEKASGIKTAQIDFEKGVNYILSEADVGKGFLKFEAKTDFRLSEGVDLENFKKGSLGKNESELENFIKSYPSIKSVDVNFWPFFSSRVPISERRVKIEIQ